MTHRQYQAWQAWLDLQWNEPDRADYYTMQLTCAVRQANARNPRKVRMKDAVIEFRAKDDRPKLTREQAAAAAKARWGAMLAGSVVEKGKPDG